MTVRKEKRRRLQAKGWTLGTTRTFLKLTPEETAYIEMKLRLASSLRERRQRGGFTQGDRRSFRVFGPLVQIALHPRGVGFGSLANHFSAVAGPSRVTRRPDLLTILSSARTIRTRLTGGERWPT